MNEPDLNDLALFAQVVEAGGFSAAERQYGTAKATASRRIARLESTLGLRLIQRDSRRFHITEAGQRIYAYAAAMRTEAAAVREVALGCHSEPQGTVRFSCPPELLTLLSPSIADFMQQYPNVQLIIESTARTVDALEENMDFVLRVRAWPLPDSPLIAKSLCISPRVLVAASKWQAKTYEELAQLPCLSSGSTQWTLYNSDNIAIIHEFHPILNTAHLQCLQDAAIAGIGVAALPLILVKNAMKQGKLHILLPDWHFREERVIALYPSRRHLIPAVRLLLETLSECLQNLITEPVSSSDHFF
ncbi:LysR substrate-binding domain-containing protein [Suttonella ornithocola]|uniref:D-malate degradation protein R n=1 Tax=Suttonella ornithocola TaxID=279832 RepID=A0A380MP23_9GAMM|nr:LysR substrate-binding domain-containing protein [Suttonella ornithocola]SUO94018.1 D-malate degradation protein R [Suttonella ornithocola]